MNETENNVYVYTVAEDNKIIYHGTLYGGSNRSTTAHAQEIVRDLRKQNINAFYTIGFMLKGAYYFAETSRYSANKAELDPRYLANKRELDK